MNLNSIFSKLIEGILLLLFYSNVESIFTSLGIDPSLTNRISSIVFLLSSVAILTLVEYIFRFFSRPVKIIISQQNNIFNSNTTNYYQKIGSSKEGTPQIARTVEVTIEIKTKFSLWVKLIDKIILKSIFHIIFECNSSNLVLQINNSNNNLIQETQKGFYINLRSWIKSITSNFKGDLSMKKKIIYFVSDKSSSSNISESDYIIPRIEVSEILRVKIILFLFVKVISQEHKVFHQKKFFY